MKAGDGTGEVSDGQRLTAAVTADISREVKFRGMPCEKSEGSIVV